MNLEHVQEFFELLRKPYDAWVSESEKGFRCAPYFDISNQLAATIFGYPGYEFTANHRDQSKQDESIYDMVIKSIDGPTVLFDWGTYDGKRLYDLVQKIPEEKQKQILAIYGIDINKRKLVEAKTLFDGVSIPFMPINQKIENLNFEALSESALFNNDDFMFSQNKVRKLTLALDNIAMNFNGLSYNHDEGITGFLRKSHNQGDLVILQAHNVIDEKNYAKNVEDFFWNYFKDSGLETLLGGTLMASYQSFRKRVHVEQMRENVVFAGKTYRFPSGIGDADPAIINIGVSGCIPYERMYEFLIFNFANNLFVPSKEDIAYVDSDVIMRFKHFEHDKWIKYAKEDSEDFEFNNSRETGFAPYLALKEYCPPFYTNFMYKISEFAGMSEHALVEHKRRNSMGVVRQVLPPTSSERLQFDENHNYF